MANITLQGNEIHIFRKFTRTRNCSTRFYIGCRRFIRKTLSDFAGKKVVFNIFPSIDTGVCAASARKFNEEASAFR